MVVKIPKLAGKSKYSHNPEPFRNWKGLLDEQDGLP